MQIAKYRPYLWAMAFVVALMSAVVLAGAAAPAFADTEDDVDKPAFVGTPDMKKANVSWKLKTNGKWQTIYTMYPKVGKKTKKIKITNYKVRSVNSKYKKVSFTLTYDGYTWTPTTSQARKILNSYYFGYTDSICGYTDVFAIDYKTGMDLNHAYGTDVSVSIGEPKNTKKWSITLSDGSWMWLGYSKQKVSIKYPKTYKDLCIGVASCPKATTSAYNKVEWNLTDVTYDEDSHFSKSGMFSKTSKKWAIFKRVK